MSQSRMAESSRPGFGFAAMAHFTVERQRCVGMVAAVVNRVDFSSRGASETMHLAGYGIELADRESSLRDPRLVGHHDHQHVELRESRQGPSDARQE